VEDSLQKEGARAVKTLSGGESFVVSLCLALGLSDLATGNRKIETLFIDEGFGSLDEESLYTVIAALKGLQATGKMVGIISHVQRLAAEISVRIKVEKESGDVSRITITG
jgi:exonuclease SbcC